MSVRYSGDTEIRLGYDRHAHVYRGTVVDPYLRFRGEVPARGRNPSSPEAYDNAARALIHQAERWAQKQAKRRFMVEKKHGRVTIQRVFHSPCPLEDL